MGILLHPHPGSRIYALIGQCMQGFWPGWTFDEGHQAHIMVCFLAYVLWKCLGQMCKRAGLGDEPRTVLEEIKTLTLADVVLPTKSGTQLRLRCVMKPEKPLAILLDRLNLRPPPRLDMQHKM